MARNSSSKLNRDGTRFLALPHAVLKSAAYTTLSGQQMRLLIDIAMQLVSNKDGNNGRLQASWRYLSEDRGWTSKDPIKRSLDALQARGLIFCTRQGRLPNKTSWYAVTWTALNYHPDMDCSPQAFPRSAYLLWKEENAC